ncbi:MAG: hypothetical protein JNM66_17860 [Bryobacterales bacterium]|nr:hypothetical protein [Bryobacterales bacterium]
MPVRSQWAMPLNADGGFRFTGLPPGDFFACVRATKGLWLDPCEWDDQLPVASLSPGKSTAEIKIILKAGVFAQVRVVDPDRLLSQHESKTPGASLLMLIETDRHLLRMVPVVSTDSEGRTHRLIVPYEKPLRLIIQSAFFKVADSAGVAVRDTEATAVSFTARKGSGLPSFSIQITGTKR